jgi:ABC-type proline/glycine betaine transport system permease subunit
VQQSRIDVRLTDTTPQEVVLALRSTGASDEDVLYAAKTEFAMPFRNQVIWGICLVTVGAVVSLTGIGALIGVPAAGFGLWMWRKGARNLDVIDSAFAQYQSSRA